MPSSRSIRTASFNDGFRLPLTRSLACPADIPIDRSEALNSRDGVICILTDFALREVYVNRKLRATAKDSSSTLTHNSRMTNPTHKPSRKKPTINVEEQPHKLKAWRKYRRLTQAELAERVGTSESVVSELENSKAEMSLKWLYRFSKALNTTVGFLVEHDPENLDTDIMEIFANVPDDMKPQAKRTLKAFQRDGTNG